MKKTKTEIKKEAKKVVQRYLYSVINGIESEEYLKEEVDKILARILKVVL